MPQALHVLLPVLGKGNSSPSIGRGKAVLRSFGYGLGMILEETANAF